MGVFVRARYVSERGLAPAVRRWVALPLLRSYFYFRSDRHSDARLPIPRLRRGDRTIILEARQA